MPTISEFSSLDLGSVAPYLAEGAELQLLRSISAREPPVKSSNGVCEKRRSTSYDETHGQFACVAEGSPVDQSEPCRKDADKASSWHSRVWRFAKGKRGARSIEGQNTKDPSLRSLTAVKEKEETVPKWRRMLFRLKSKAKEAHKSAICSSNLDFEVAYYDQLGVKREIKSRIPVLQGEIKQRPYSVYPEPVLSRRNSIATPIWERRNVAQPTTLDLSNLKITGLKHLPRPH